MPTVTGSSLTPGIQFSSHQSQGPLTLVGVPSVVRYRPQATLPIFAALLLQSSDSKALKIGILELDRSLQTLIGCRGQTGQVSETCWGRRQAGGRVVAGTLERPCAEKGRAAGNSIRLLPLQDVA